MSDILKRVIAESRALNEARERGDLNGLLDRAIAHCEAAMPTANAHARAQLMKAVARARAHSRKSSW